MAGGKEVGKVWIRVAPNLRGFREETEREIAKIDDAVVDVNGNLRPLEKKIAKAKPKLEVTAEVSEESLERSSRLALRKLGKTHVRFDAVLNKSRVLREAQDLSKSLSGIKFSYTGILSQRFKDPSLGLRGALPGLRSDLQFLREAAEQISLQTLGNSVIKTSQQIEKVSKRLRSVTNAVAVLGKGGFKAFRLFGSGVRTAVSPVLFLGKTLAWATGGEWVSNKLGGAFRDLGGSVKAFATQLNYQVYGSVLRTKQQLKELSAVSIQKVLDSKPVKVFNSELKRVQASFSAIPAKVAELKAASKEILSLDLSGAWAGKHEAVKSINAEIAAIRKLSGARKAFNRNKLKSYNPGLHQEFKALEAEAKNLKNADPLSAYDRLPQIIDRARELQKALGASDTELAAFEKKAALAEKAFAKLNSRMKFQDIVLRVRAPMDAFKGTKFAKGLQDRLGTFKNSSAYKELQRMSQFVSGLASGFRNVGAAAGKFGLVGVIQQFGKFRANATKAVDATKMFGGAAQALGKTLRGVFTRTPATQGMAKLTKSFDKGTTKIQHSSRKILGLTRLGWIVAAIGAVVGPVIQLVSGAVAALPALGLAAGAALGVTLLGLDGIKKAGEQLSPVMDQLKSSISGVFEQRMTPQFAQLGSWLQGIESDLVSVANGMADFSQGFFDGLSSGKGLGTTKELLANTAGLFADLKPFASSFTEGLLEMGAAGSRSFDKLAEGLNSFGTKFSSAVSELSASGALESAVEDTFTVLGSFSMNVGKLMRAGIERSGDMVQPWTTFFDGVTNGLIGLMDLTAGFATAVGGVFAGLGSVIQGLGTAIGPSLEVVGGLFSQLFMGVGAQLGELLTGLAPMFTNFITPLQGPLSTAITMITDTLGGLGVALQPFFDSLGSIGSVLGTALGNSITVITTALAPVLPTLVSAFGLLAESIGNALVPVFEALAPVLPVLAEAFASIAAVLGEAFATALTAIAPLIQQIAPVLGEVLVAGVQALAPVLPQLVDAFMQLVSALMPLLPPLIDLAMAVLPPLLSILPPIIGLVASVASAFVEVLNAVMPVIEIIAQVAAVFLGLLATIVGWAANVIATIVGWAANVISTVVGWGASFVSTIVGFLAEALSTVINWVANVVSEVGSLVGKAKSALGNVGSALIDSGKALIQGFIDGIKSMIGKVTEAVGNVMGKVREFFPFSPAKTGPFSGKGYTTHSGKALMSDFAAGMLSEKSTVVGAVQGVLGAAASAFRDPVASLEGMHRQKILKPVLEANAEKIAKFREDEAKASEDLAKRIEEINHSDSKAAKKEQKIAEARSKHAEKQAEAKQKLLESLDTPDYDKIPRSFEKFYVDGIKEMLRTSLTDGVEKSGFVDAIRRSALSGVAEARKIFGSHPVLGAVESSVNSKAFSHAIQRTIEDSGIAEVPVNVFISNLDQFKSDLGLGSGVISRAVEQAMAFDPSESDSRKFKDSESKTEVHYHVTDMEEAIRLEKLRERKQLMKIR